MYLVLTAMLALNVSADIINGFSKLRHSMETSMGATFSRTETVMANFEAEYNKDEASQAKYGPWYEAAKAVHQTSEEMYNYLEHFKLDVANMVDNPEVPYDKMPEGLKAGDDTNKPHAYALLEVDPTSGRLNAEELKYRLNQYAEFMSTPSSECVMERMERKAFREEIEAKSKMIKSLFITEDVYDEAEMQYIGWEESTFHEMPAAAVTALIAKYQNDVRTVEYDMINFLFAQTSASAFIANKVDALVMPTNGEYIMQGQHYRAKIVSAMVDTTNVPRVFIGNQEIFDGIYDVLGTTPGEHKFNGYMLIGEDTTHYAFSGQYTVGQPSATISNVDLDIMYRGYDNKFKISVPGVKDDEISITVDGGSYQKTSEGWLIRTTETAKTVTVNVLTKVDGQLKSMGSQVFRVKPMPTPMGSIKAGEKEYADGEGVPAAKWATSTSVIASYGKDGILNVPFEVVSFTLVINGTPYYAKGSNLSKEMVDKLKTAKVGTRVTVEDLKAKNKMGGKEQRLNSFTVKTAY